MFSSREVDQGCHFKLNFEDQEVYRKVEESQKDIPKVTKTDYKDKWDKAGIKSKWHI